MIPYQTIVFMGVDQSITHHLVGGPHTYPIWSMIAAQMEFRLVGNRDDHANHTMKCENHKIRWSPIYGTIGDQIMESH